MKKITIILILLTLNLSIIYAQQKAFKFHPSITTSDYENGTIIVKLKSEVPSTPASAGRKKVSTANLGIASLKKELSILGTRW